MKRNPTGRVGVRIWTSAAVLGLAGTLAGCGSHSAGPSVASLPGASTHTSTGAAVSADQSDQEMVQFARCLRAHGVDEPDPFHRPGHDGLTVAIPRPGPSTNSALAACNHFIAPLVQAKQAHARQQLASWLPQLTRYAQCMRSRDISMLDPDANGSLNLGSVPGITSDFGRYSPQFHAADSACRHFLPAAVHDNGTGP